MAESFQHAENGQEVNWEKRIIVLALILALLSFAGCTVLSVLEVVSFRVQWTPYAAKSGITPAIQPAPPTPPIHPQQFLPDEIDGFLLNSKHPVPGYESYMAEAIYQPEAEELSLVAPINTYVKVTYFETGLEADKAIRENLVDLYPEAHKNIDLYGQRALTGYDEAKKSFFIGWTKGSYAIEIDTSFTSTAPAKKDQSLEETGASVAQAVQQQVAAVLGR